MASSDSIGGVPTRARSMPAAGWYVPPIANGSAWPFQPGQRLVEVALVPLGHVEVRR